MYIAVSAFRSSSSALVLPIGKPGDNIVVGEVAAALLRLLPLLDLRVQALDGGREIGRPLLHRLLELTPVALERSIVRLDLVEHFIESVDQQPHFAPWHRSRPQREILFGRNSVGDLDQLLDRAGDPAMQKCCEYERDASRRGNRDQAGAS